MGLSSGPFELCRVVPMETQVARRRINLLSAHFAPSTDDISLTNVFPMNCSSSLNSVVRRGHNRMHFARQGSASQGYFMRQATIEERNHNCDSILDSVVRRCDNRMHFARQGSSSQGYFMRQATTEEVTEAHQVTSAQSDVPHKSLGYEGSYNIFEAPLFSGPKRKEPNFPHTGQPTVQGCMLTMSEPPKFSRPRGRNKLHDEKRTHSSEAEGIEWSPRMDIAESGRNYVMLVEIPGVNTNDIRVEVDDQKLAVRGIRSTQDWKVAGSSNGSISSYHKREISRGPYQVIWRLPAGINKDGVSAEFLNGFLQIIIPKL